MVEETDFQSFTLDRISEVVDQLAEDERFVLTILEVTDTNDSNAVKKLIRNVAEEVLDLR